MAKTKKPKTKKTRKAEKSESTFEEKLEAEVNRVQANDPAFAGEVIKAFEDWEQVREFAKKERERTAELVAARQAAFAESMEVGHKNEADQVLKLTVVEQRWQELEEAKTERKEIGSSCRDNIKLSLQKIKDLLAAYHAPPLPLFARPNTDPSTYESTSTIDNPPYPEEDEPEEDLGDSADADN